MNKYIDFFKKINLKPWESQIDILNFINKNIDKKYFIIDAPTGCGKSHAALALSETNRIYIVTNSKFLQDQYLSLYKGMILLKGKNNYECGLNKKLNCENGYCSSFPKIKSKCIKGNLCPYYNQLNLAINSKIVIMNYDYLLYAIHCGAFAQKNYNDENYKEKIIREILVCDEAHLLENKLVNFVEFTFNIKEISENYNLHEILKYNFIDNEIKNNDILYNINILITEKCKYYKLLMDNILNKYEDEILSLFGNNEKFELSSEDKNELNKLHKLFYSLDKINQKLTIYFNNYQKNRWILKKLSNKEIFLSPYKASGLFDLYIDKIAKKFVLMSATIGDSNEFIKEFGFFENITCSISINSDFDAKQSPIVLTPIGKMNYSNIENMLPIISSSIDKIISEFHPDEKGIIHTTNYRIADYIFKSLNNNRFIYGKNENNKLSNEEMFDLHKKTKKPTILISPSLTEGISLDDDLSRFQIIVKLPFLSLENYRTKIKMTEDEKWYIFRMWIAFMQSAGRSTRSKEDYSVTYVLDSNFNYFYNKSINSIPKWFKERIIL